MRGTGSAAGWLVMLAACGSSAVQPASSSTAAASGAREAAVTFGDDLAFLERHSKLVVLQDQAGTAQVIVAPEYQGRVMTSTAAGPTGASFGWINRGFIAAGKRVAHMNVFGGEDRFWLGPEGGQYALYFPPGAAFDLEHWQVPEPIDWGAWAITASARAEVRLAKDMQLQNRAGFTFDLRVERAVRVLEPARVASALGVALGPAVAIVGYESENVVHNVGQSAWSRDTGLLSIWILGMFNPSPKTVIVIPFRQGSEQELGPTVNDAYFGKVPKDRLVVGPGVLFFRGDGGQRGKIGIPRPRALPTLGAYDAAGKVLTLVQYTLPAAPAAYVNSMWEVQEQPYAGDVVNSYNDGPLAPGKPPLGPFWELETSSPAAALAPGESITHVHRTMHLTAPRAELDAIARAALGVTLDQIERAFP
jgi:hypothetical protein